MKTKAIFLKLVAGLVLIAMVHTVAFSQKNSISEYSKHLFSDISVMQKTVIFENNINIQDWMLDDLAFVFRSENEHMEDWMVMFDDYLDTWLVEAYYNTDWMFEADVLPALNIIDWMVEDMPNVGMSLTETLEDFEMMDWMLLDTHFGNVISDETIELQKWMLDADGIGSSYENDIALQNWMLDQKYWN